MSAMKIDHVIRQAEMAAAKLWSAEEEMTATFRKREMLPAKDPDWDALKVPKIDKLAGGVVIIDRESLAVAKSLGEIRLVLQVAKIGQRFYGETETRDYYRLAVPGGAVRSREENEAIESGEVPQMDSHRAFYYVVQRQLATHCAVSMNYDLEAGLKEVVAADAFKKVAEEMGVAAASSLSLQGWSSALRKESFLKNLQLIDPVTTAAIAHAINSPDVIHEVGTTKLSGIITRVNEGNIIALAQVGEVVDRAEETAHQKGVKVLTLAEAVRIVQSGASEEGYTNYRKLYPDDRIDGTRNPSLAWHLGQAVRWIANYAKSKDSYVEGTPRRNVSNG